MGWLCSAWDCGACFPWLCNKLLTPKCVWDKIENQGREKRESFLSSLLIGVSKVWNNDSPIKALPSDRQNPLLPHRTDSKHLSLELFFFFPSFACLFWVGMGERISSFDCEHHVLNNSFHESLGDLCLFIYLAASSFLKPRPLRVLKVRTDPAVAVRVAIHAFQLSVASRNIL